jgi:uroporphyrinogen decarboxylase
MNSRQRIEMALNHREADRIPSDLGATVMSSFHREAYRNLREHLGLPAVDIRIADLFQQLVYVDEDVRRIFEVDVQPANPSPSTAGAHVEIKEDMPGYRYYYDEWGIGWKMPREGGFYYDVFHHPLGGDVTVADIERYPWPDPVDPARLVGLRERARKIAEDDEQAVVVGGLCAGFVEMAGWLRGYEQYLMDFVDAPARLEALFDRLLEMKIAFWDKVLPEVGDYATAVLESDDLGSQRDLLFSPRFYRQYVKPRHKQLFDHIHSRTKAKILFHSCGAIRKVLPDLIEAGIDILNPVQVAATGMDSAGLKRDFG